MSWPGPARLQPTLLVDVRFRLLADAARPLKHNQLVDFFVGAAEIGAHVRLLGTEVLEPGAEAFVQLRLERPVVVVAGDRFILRQPSPSATLGGGVILSPHPRRRWRRHDPKALARLATLAHGLPDEILLHALERHPLSTPAALVAASELESADATAALDELRAQGAVVVIAGGEPLLLSLTDWTRPARRRRRPAGRLSPPVPAAPRPAAQRGAQQAPGAVARNDARRSPLQRAAGRAGAGAARWRPTMARSGCPTSPPRPRPPQQQRIDRLLAAYAAAPYAPPNLPDTLALLGRGRRSCWRC